MCYRFYLPTHVITKRFSKRHYVMLSICTWAQTVYSLVCNFDFDLMVKIGFEIFIGGNKSRPTIEHRASKVCRIADHVRISKRLRLSRINPIYKYFHNSSRWFNVGSMKGFNR